MRAPVAELSPAERAIVAMARALDGWSRPDNVLILDEVRALADRVVVLRDGRKVAEAGAGHFDDDLLIKAIVGSGVAQTQGETQRITARSSWPCPA